MCCQQNLTMYPCALSKTERRALEFLAEKGGGVLVSAIPELNCKGIVFGDVIPGQGVYRKLERRGLCFFTIEDPVDSPGENLDGFTFTPEIYISDEGVAAIAALQK